MNVNYNRIIYFISIALLLFVAIALLVIIYPSKNEMNMVFDIQNAIVSLRNLNSSHDLSLPYVPDIQEWEVDDINNITTYYSHNWQIDVINRTFMIIHIRDAKSRPIEVSYGTFEIDAEKKLNAVIIKSHVSILRR